MFNEMNKNPNTMSFEEDATNRNTSLFLTLLLNNVKAELLDLKCKIEDAYIELKTVKNDYEKCSSKDCSREVLFGITKLDAEETKLKAINARITELKDTLAKMNREYGKDDNVTNTLISLVNVQSRFNSVYNSLVKTNWFLTNKSEEYKKSKKTEL